ncbi:MAG: SOS response-associated peptidase [Pseudomonadota bacterium]
MCGRFALQTLPPHLATLFDAEPGDVSEKPRSDIRPTQSITAVVSSEGQRSLTPMRWGFLPHWYSNPKAGPLLINARAETIAEKPAFREACRARRCLIPADGFYEWQAQGEKQKKRVHWLEPSAGGLVAFAGIWQMGRLEDGRSIATTAIVTTAASADVTHIHHRLPLVIGPNSWPLWLGEAGKGAARLMTPPLEGFWAVTPDKGPR